MAAKSASGARQAAVQTAISAGNKQTAATDGPQNRSLLVDTNILVDFLGQRQPFFADAKLLMLAGKVGEFTLWASATQITDLVYILSEGGKKSLMPSVLQRVDKLLTFVRLYSPDRQDIGQMLGTGWEDPEDALLHQAAMRIQAAAIITRNQADFQQSLIPVFDCTEFFAKLQQEFGISYAEVTL